MLENLVINWLMLVFKQRTQGLARNMKYTIKQLFFVGTH